ncbi:hypothetical protein OAK81_02705 [Verrucomicrobiales bacterium]|nr:hypothetical protein [bacterium]MDC0292183.1 hypothetical protein [Verrucomicrobiales bacterium]
MKSQIQHFIAIAVSGAGLCSAVAQGPKPPEKLDLAAFPGEIVEKVVVPVPAEVFAVLDKLDEPNWTQEIQIPEESRLETKDRVKLSLGFGSLVAEGFIAVQAQDVAEIKTIGEQALKLGNSLGLGDAVQAHSLSIVDGAEREDWRRVRAELDRTQATVRETMTKLRDDDLGTLVSLGGWIRGTSALTSLISDNFNQDKSELLNQPSLVEHFIKSIDSMDPLNLKHEDVVQIRTGLVALLVLIQKEDENDAGISAEDVAAMGDICREILELFYFENDEKANEDGGQGATDDE